MASVCSTSPTNFSLPGNASHPFASSTSPKSSTLYSSSPSHPLHRRTSQHTSPRKSPFTLHANYGSSFIPPLALPRGHDSSDIAALSSSLEEPKGHTQGTRSAIETSLDMAVAAAGISGPHSLSKASTMPEQAHSNEDDPMGPFEGPEKLLEVWFADSRHDVIDGGLMRVEREVWENMLDIVKCKVLSIIKGNDVDAYLLSESSMFVFPHKLILKTCGTTTLLLGLERLLNIAYDALKTPDSPFTASCLSQVDLGKFVKRCFYSRKSFMFPERQKGPHRDWTLEVSLLDQFFDTGSAYTVGKMNGNHWLLYMTAPRNQPPSPALTVARPLRLPSLQRPNAPQDETLEILMTHLSPASCSRFEFPESLATPDSSQIACSESDRGHLLGTQLCHSLGLLNLFPGTTLDAYAFEPCGFSANAIIRHEADKLADDTYWTVHVTPEHDSSYASFETNAAASKDLPWLIARVLSIFEPNRLSVTLFTSSSSENEEGMEVRESNGLVTLAESKQNQSDVLHALQLKQYRRTDRIAYEFEDYDLVFVSFDKIDASFSHR